jgi:hypothetical protein
MISTKEFAGHRTGTRPRPSADTATRGCVRCCSTGKRVRLVTGRALDKPYPVQPKALFISHRYPRYFKSLAQLTPSESVRVSDRIIEICEDSCAQIYHRQDHGDGCERGIPARFKERRAIPIRFEKSDLFLDPVKQSLEIAAEPGLAVPAT